MMYFCGVWDALIGLYPRFNNSEYMRGYNAEKLALRKNRLDAEANS